MVLRSTLVRPVQRSCPECGNVGFKRVGATFFHDPVFRCHACGWEWSSERGPIEGTDRRTLTRNDDEAQHEH